MCQFCPEIVAYRLDGNRNLIPIYEEGWEDEAEGDIDAAAAAIEARMAKILKQHGGAMPNGLSGEAPLA